MNQIIADNSVQAMREYLQARLSSSYEERELQNVIAALFDDIMKWSRSEMIMHSRSRLSESEMLRFHFAAKRLEAGEPLQYVLGKAWFSGRTFDVNPSVLIPRPETEELVALVLRKTGKPDAKVLDVGTGSGCIAITLKCERPLWNVTAMDISAKALQTASENASKNQADIIFSESDFLSFTPEKKFDVVVSNPPYIYHSESTQMRKQVVNHEPHLALFTDGDPLIFYKHLIELAPLLLEPEGKVYCEIHEDKKEELEQLLRNHGIPNYRFHQDLQQKYRMLEFSL